MRSFPYTIGYGAVGEFYRSKELIAKVKNWAGHIIDPLLSPVMSRHVKNIHLSETEMPSTADLYGTDEFDYPISGYTFMFVRRKSMRDCRAGEELLRYIGEWIFRNRTEAKLYLRMVPNFRRSAESKSRNAYDTGSGRVGAENNSKNSNQSFLRRKISVG